MKLQPVHPNDFLVVYAKALRIKPMVKANCTPLHQVELIGARCYLEHIHGHAPVAGYVVKHDGELCYLFALVRGAGDVIVRHAIAMGATHLDCFDGYLVELYKRHGFKETRRVPNYTKGGPDVVYMALSRLPTKSTWHPVPAGKRLRLTPSVLPAICYTINPNVY